MSDLSIILVSYNSKAYLEQCLLCLKKATEGLNSEIIVVDNASSDGSIEMVESKFPRVVLIKNSKNVGFGAANNQALKIAQGKYQLLLNPDTEINDRELLSNMVSWMDKHPEVGVSSGVLINSDGSYQPTGGYFPSLARVFAWMFFLDDLPVLSQLASAYHPKPSFYQKERQLDWVTGAFFFLRPEALKSIGNFNEDYFMYVEEVDLCYRLKAKGWQIYLLPQFRIIHHGQAVSGSEYAITQEFKGLNIFFRDYYPKWQLPVLKLCLKLGALLRIVIFGLLKGGKIAKTYVKAFQVA